MAYIVLSAGGEEIERCELTAALIIGRSPECDVSVRDILLSRRHCRLEPVGRMWRIVDLDSKNGTRVGLEKVRKRILTGGEEVRIGRTLLSYHTGDFVPAPEGTPKRPKLVRPADPFEALSGTVSGFVFVDPQPEAANGDAEQPGESVSGDFEPSPQPSLVRLTAKSGQAELVSSSWESIATLAARRMPDALTMRAAPCPMPRPTMRSIRMPAPGVAYSGSAPAHAKSPDLCLQAAPEYLQAPRHRARASGDVAIRLVLMLLVGGLTTILLVMTTWLLELMPSIR